MYFEFIGSASFAEFKIFDNKVKYFKKFSEFSKKLLTKRKECDIISRKQRIEKEGAT